MNANSSCAVGRSYLHAAQITAGHPRASGEYLAPPIYTLIGFSLELFMKAALAHRGYRPDVLRKKFGHDLRKLFATCRAEGYSGGLAGLVEQVVGRMHDHYVGNTFYLPPGATLVAPDVQQSLPVLVGFDSEVAALIEVR